jgi:predicted protein tyrosine phosphatase
MLLSVCFVSQRTFEDHVDPAGNVVAISITDPDERPAKVRPGFRAVLRLSFHDIMEESLGLNVGDLPDLHPRHAVGVRLFWGQAELCDANDARRVLTFLDHHANSAEKLHLVVHCHAGISRSAAVAAFAADRFGIEIDQANPDTSCANTRLLRLLGKVDLGHPLHVGEVPQGLQPRPKTAYQSSLSGIF